jgi:hypothetical protein
VNDFLSVLLSAYVLVFPFLYRLSSGKGIAGLLGSVPDRWNRLVPAIALPVFTLMLVVLRYDAGLAAYVACRQLYKQERWDALLERAKENRGEDIRVQFMTNFALYKKGVLLEEMFKYPQPWGTRGLVFNYTGPGDLEHASPRALYNCDLYYEMGLINAAYRHAYNYRVGTGRTYEALEYMAKCHMVNENYALAAKYLDMLERTTFHRGFGRRYRAMIGDPVAMEREFGDLRKRVPGVDIRSIRFAPTTVPLLGLLDTRSDNRMAFDYLMAWLLLDKNKESMATIAKNIQRFKDVGYASIPTHCQESLLTLERQQGAPVDLQGFSYDQATRAREEKFFRDLLLHWGREDTPHRLLPRYGETYMFYYSFVVTPADGGRPMPTRSDERQE